MNTFKEFKIGEFVLRFYKIDHGWICTLNEGVVDACITELDKQKQTIRNLEKSLGFKNSGYETINLTPQTKQGEPVFEESNEQVVNAFYKQFPEMKPQTKPLSDEEIKEIASKFFDSKYYHYEGLAVLFARAIEKAHGIS